MSVLPFLSFALKQLQHIKPHKKKIKNIRALGDTSTPNTSFVISTSMLNIHVLCPAVFYTLEIQSDLLQPSCLV